VSRARQKRMCPNPECEKHGQPTGLLGGCDCGAPLVAYKPPEPNDDQLWNVMVVMGVPEYTAHLMVTRHDLRPTALEFHALVAAAVTGDPAANERLKTIRERMAMFRRLTEV
jgi:hypothetical protein